MNLSETAQVLAIVGAFSGRKPNEAEARAWHLVLGDLAAADVAEAVRRYYATETAWIMPAHVRRIVMEINRERSVSPWAPGQYGVPREEAAPQVSIPGRLEIGDLPDTTRDLISRLRSLLPESDPDALRPRTAAWRRQHQAWQRQRTAEPNPYYDPEVARREHDGVGSEQTGTEEEDPWT